MTDLVPEQIDGTEEDAQLRWLNKLLTRDLPSHINRIREQSSPSVGWLQLELHGTVLSFLGDLAAYLRDFQMKVWPWLEGVTGHVEEHEERLNRLEEFVDALGQESQLLPADADEILAVAQGAKLLADKLLADPGHSVEGKKHLEEMIERAGRVEQLVAQLRLDVDEEDEEEADLVAAPAQEQPS